MIFSLKQAWAKFFSGGLHYAFLALAGLTKLIKRLDDFYPKYCSQKSPILYQIEKFLNGINL